MRAENERKLNRTAIWEPRHTRPDFAPARSGRACQPVTPWPVRRMSRAVPAMRQPPSRATWAPTP